MHECVVIQIDSTRSDKSCVDPGRSPPPFSKLLATPSVYGTHTHTHTHTHTQREGHGGGIGEDEQSSRRDTDVIMRVWVYFVSTLNDGDGDEDEEKREKRRRKGATCVQKVPMERDKKKKKKTARTQCGDPRKVCTGSGTEGRRTKTHERKGEAHAFPAAPSLARETSHAQPPTAHATIRPRFERSATLLLLTGS